MSILNSYTFGTGAKSVVLVHGWAASGRMWENVYPHFSNASFHALEFKGFGKTPSSLNPPTIEKHVANLIEFCNETKPQMLIAHSMGGLITLKAVIEQPDIAQQLVLIAPVVTGKFGLYGIMSNIIRNRFGVAALRASEMFWPLLQREYLLKLTLEPWHQNAYLAKRVRQDFLEVNHHAALEALVGMAQEDTSPHLGEIQQPTLVCVGENDLTVPPSEGKTAAKLIPNAQLVLFDSARHHPMDEQTADFVPVLKDFLGKYGIV